jgi:hypothetical protein
MGTVQATFAGEQWGSTGIDVTEVTSVTCPVRKYVLCIRNRKLRNIRPSGDFWPEVTKSRGRKGPCSEGVMTGSMFGPCPVFSRVFFLSSSNMATGCDLRSLVPPSGFSWVCACATGSCATPVVTEGHVTPLEISMGCSLGRPRPVTIGYPASYI